MNTYQVQTTSHSTRVEADSYKVGDADLVHFYVANEASPVFTCSAEHLQYVKILNGDQAARERSTRIMSAALSQLRSILLVPGGYAKDEDVVPRCARVVAGVFDQLD